MLTPVCVQELFRRLEFSLIKRRIERGTYFWSANAQEMAEEARCARTQVYVRVWAE